MIRDATVADAADICKIYNHYVLQTSITFEEIPVTIDEMERRIQQTTASLPWLVWQNGSALLGYCYASPWRVRPAYRHSVESTVYLQSEATGKGIGSKLYEALLSELRQREFHAVVGGIALPNEASVALHEKLGFEKVAHLKEIGYKFGRWIDVGYWQNLLPGAGREICAE